MSEVLSASFHYDVDRVQRLDSGHYWVDSRGYQECHWCGTRSHWPGGAEPCAAPKDWRGFGKGTIDLDRHKRTSDKHERAMRRADKVRKMHAAGFGLAAIARKLRMKRDYVRKIVNNERLAKE